MTSPCSVNLIFPCTDPAGCTGKGAGDKRTAAQATARGRDSSETRIQPGVKEPNSGDGTSLRTRDRGERTRGHRTTMGHRRGKQPCGHWTLTCARMLSCVGPAPLPTVPPRPWKMSDFTPAASVISRISLWALYSEYALAVMPPSLHESE